jgi:hypothetical protein
MGCTKREEAVALVLNMYIVEKFIRQVKHNVNNQNRLDNYNDKDVPKNAYNKTHDTDKIGSAKSVKREVCHQSIYQRYLFPAGKG